jgi:hypothetical protein
MDGKTGMQSGKLRQKSTSRLRTTSRQAGKNNLKEEHNCIKKTCSLKQKF